MGRIFFLIVIGLAGLVGYGVWDSRDLSAATLEARYADETSAFIHVNGARIHYRDEGAGPVILMVHGYSTHLQNWDGWAAALKKDRRVVRLDLPGHGLTGPYPAGDYSPDAQTAMVAAFVEALALKDVTVIGNSLGGLIAWRYALQRQDNTRALVLVSPGGFLGPQAAENEAGDVPALAAALKYVFPTFLARAALETNYADDAKVTAPLVRRYRDLIRREGNRDALLAALRQFTLYEPEDTLGRIATPTLILWGAQDEVLPASDATRFSDAMPNAELVVFDDLGHILMEEAPTRTLPVVNAFLERLAAPPADDQANDQADDQAGERIDERIDGRIDE